METVIYWEFCKSQQFLHTDKSYKDKPESVLENEMYKISWDLETETNQQISVRRLDFELIKRKTRTYNRVDFAVQEFYWVKVNEGEKQEK